METKENLLTELEIKLEAIIFKFENSFKNSGQDLDKFYEDNENLINREIASESTNTLHQGILNNIGTELDFIQEVQELSYAAGNNLLVGLYMISESNSR